MFSIFFFINAAHVAPLDSLFWNFSSGNCVSHMNTNKHARTPVGRRRRRGEEAGGGGGREREREKWRKQMMEAILTSKGQTGGLENVTTVWRSLPSRGVTRSTSQLNFWCFIFCNTIQKIHPKNLPSLPLFLYILFVYFFQIIFWNQETHHINVAPWPRIGRMESSPQDLFLLENPTKIYIYI